MTIAIILILLVLPFLVLTTLEKRWPSLWMPPGLRGRIGLALVLLFTATGHFIRTEPMIAMLPESVPWRAEIVLLTGLLEYAAAIGLLVPSAGIVRVTGICLALFLIAVFPANVYSAVSGKGLGSHGLGPWYLLFRAPLQFVLIGWTWRFAICRDALPAGGGKGAPRAGGGGT